MAQENVQATATNTDVPTFQLSELRVLGNSVMAPMAIQNLLMPYLGPNRSLQDVEAARLMLETEYHAKGYGTVYVDIPEQNVAADGVVRLHVTEARLRMPSITGAKYFSNRQIRAAIPQAAADVVPNLPQLQAQINAVNLVSADRQIVPVLKAGPVPGTVDLNLKVQDRIPLHAVAELNNQYTADTTQLRASLALSYANAFARQDNVSLQYQTSPQDTREVSVFVASYLARLGDSQNKLNFAYIDSSSRVATIGDITVAGKGSNYYVDFIRSLLSSRDELSSLYIGVHYKDSQQGVSLAANESLDTPLSYTSLQAGYSASWFFEQRVWSLAGSWILGLPGLGSTRQEFADKCYGCKPNFSLVHADASVSQQLPLDLSLELHTAAQYSVDPLVSNEQFLIGGINSLRGYLEADELGDVGVRGGVELHAPKLIPSFLGLTLAPYVFYDAGRVSYQQPAPGQTHSASLQSAGFGIDLQAWQHLSGTLVIARPLVTSSHTRRGETRLHFWVRGSW